MDRVKRIWYLSPMRAAKVQASLRIRAVSPEPSLLAHTSSESRATFRQKARSLAPLNGWACAVKICHDGMLEDTNSLDSAHKALQPECQVIGKNFKSNPKRENTFLKIWWRAKTELIKCQSRRNSLWCKHRCNKLDQKTLIYNILGSYFGFRSIWNNRQLTWGRVDASWT